MLQSRWVGLLVLSSILVTGGCSSTPCEDESHPTFRDRLSPIRAVQYLRYTVENECDRRVYDGLTEASREEVAYWKFYLGYRGVEHPVIEVPIVDLVESLPDDPSLFDEVKSARWPGAMVVGGEASFELDGEPSSILLLVILFKENGVWKIGGRETVEANQRR